MLLINLIDFAHISDGKFELKHQIHFHPVNILIRN